MFLKPIAKFAEWATHPHKKRVYMFNEGSIEDRALLGNKGAKVNQQQCFRLPHTISGANLCEMVHLKLPVPVGFVITTETCLEYFAHLQTLEATMNPDAIFPQYFKEEYTHAVQMLERKAGRHFGGEATKAKPPVASKEFPLLLSVRSGAAVSMPGMMDTILNLGMNDEVAAQIARATENPRFALDTYRRFLQMYGCVVLGIKPSCYEEVLATTRQDAKVVTDAEFTEIHLQHIVDEFKKLAVVPTDPWEQLREAIMAVFNSWFTPRAVAYRDIHGISSTLGTAVIIQSMVYGNMNFRSGSGVAFTRNPSTGEKVFFGEYLPNAEGKRVAIAVKLRLRPSVSSHCDGGWGDEHLLVFWYFFLSRETNQIYRDSDRPDSTHPSNKTS